MTDDDMSHPARPATAIDAIAEAWVDTELDLFPEYRVYLGRPGREGEYADYSPAGTERAVAEAKRTLAAVQGATPVDDVDLVTKMDLSRELQLQVDKHEAGFDQRDLNVIASAPQSLRDIFDLMPTDSEEDWSHVATRMRNLPAAMTGYIETLRTGIAAGNVPAIRQIREVIAQADRQVADTGFFFQFAEGAKAESIAREILPGASVAEAIAFLDQDQSRKLHGTDALQKWMQETSDRAVDELSKVHFDIPVEVRRLECMIAPTQEGGIYYTPPTDDFSRAGRMWWSVPRGVTEFDTWRELTTVYHEGVPGHHLQIGQAVYNKALLNTWRRNAGTSGHAEGWALYAERLMEQLGYLDDPADRLGMLDGQRMRAARVVLDIGVHLEKPLPDGSGPWSGEYAFGFLGRNVNMNEGFVRFEVNRYLGWPGQAPSYKIGQRIWEQLRDEYARREGADFDIRAFHKKALDIGGVGLDTLKAALLA
jgi:uncharacterized protein (DUF885 family)